MARCPKGMVRHNGQCATVGITVVEDRMGSLHIWEGDRNIRQVDKYLFHDEKGNESDAFLQFEDDRKYFMENIPKRYHHDIENGWTVKIPISDMLGIDEFIESVVASQKARR
jgi:hypothetical protein